MHPWNGKTKQQRKEYIEKLLVKFKTEQIAKEGEEKARLLKEFKKKKSGQAVPPHLLNTSSRNRSTAKTAKNSPLRKSR